MLENKTSEPKIYLGNGQEKSRRSGDKFIIASLCVDDIVNSPDEYKKEARNGKRYVKVLINPYRGGANEYGNTHSISLDTYKNEGEAFE
jgi:hypothetical protein